MLTANPLEAIQLGTVGTKLPLTEIRIITDEDGMEAGVEEPGELQARGLQVMRGYWNRPDATAEVMTDDGFFKTGDVAVIQEDGYYRIVDRIKDLINVSGFNVFPAEIEDVLAGLDGVLECGVVGVMGDNDIEQVKVCCGPRPDPQLRRYRLRTLWPSLGTTSPPTRCRRSSSLLTSCRSRPWAKSCAANCADQGLAWRRWSTLMRFGVSCAGRG